MTFDTIDDILADIAAGKMVVITDDEDRENEGDLVMAAEKVTPEAINFMATHGRGLICAPLTEERARALGLQSMVPKNREMFKTDFTVSVDAATGVTTGISAPDRARTILALADDNCTADDLVQPGHIFPLQAREGGVLRRAGHTEASVDLARLAGLRPAGVICEILRKDGTMARLPDLVKFCKRHKLRIGTIRDLIAWRTARERLVRREQAINLPTIYGTFKLYLYRATHSEEYHLALTLGPVGSDGTPELVRVHSECLTGDVFGSLRCDCGPQLHDALQQIGAEGRGVLLYMRQEGRGIGLPAKIAAYKLQEEGLDTVEANARLGFPMDLRDYGFGAQMLADLGLKNIRLMTNNPKKIVGLEGYGLTVTEQVPIRPPAAANPHNERYLETKREKMGHLL